MSLNTEEKQTFRNNAVKGSDWKRQFFPKKLAKVIFKKYYGTLSCLQGEIDDSIKGSWWRVYWYDSLAKQFGNKQQKPKHWPSNSSFGIFILRK